MGVTVRVFWVRGGKCNRLAMGSSPMGAATNALFTAGHRMKRDREKLFRAGAVKVWRMGAFRARLTLGLSKKRVALFAADAHHAARTMGEGWVAAWCDPVHALMELPDEALWRLAMDTWVFEAKKRGQSSDHYVPHIADIGRKQSRGHVLDNLERRSVAYCLRLAMHVPALGASPLARCVEGSENRKRLIAERKRLHEDMPEKLVTAMVDLFGDSDTFVAQNNLDILREFCAFYGMDAEKMPWTEAIALWRGGPKAHRLAELDTMLGIGKRGYGQGEENGNNDRGGQP